MPLCQMIIKSDISKIYNLSWKLFLECSNCHYCINYEKSESKNRSLRRVIWMQPVHIFALFCSVCVIILYCLNYSLIYFLYHLFLFRGNIDSLFSFILCTCAFVDVSCTAHFQGSLNYLYFLIPLVGSDLVLFLCFSLP